MKIIDFILLVLTFLIFCLLVYCSVVMFSNFI